MNFVSISKFSALVNLIVFLEEVPVIEGQLKEKSGGKWRIFRKWKSRYFTLSGKYIFKLRFYCLKENLKK